MIIEYRKTNGADHFSRVLRTYKDVSNIDYSHTGLAILYGVTPAEMDEAVIVKYAQVYIIAVIKLADGEYLERVDLPRD